MTTYRATVFGDRYPVTVDVAGSSWHVAANRAAQAYEKKFKGSRATTLTIKIVKAEAGHVV